MVRKQRRMTVKKKASTNPVKLKPTPGKSTKGKVRSTASRAKSNPQTDRASQAQKTLIKAIQSMEEKE